MDMLVAMETDAFFYQPLKQVPQALFELIGLPGEGAAEYRFDSVELKKAFRIEGVLLRRFTNFDRLEIRKMFPIHDIRESKVWQEARESGGHAGARKDHS